MMKRINLIAAIALVCSVSLPLAAAETTANVTVKPSTQKFLGDVTEFNRDKFLTMHTVQETEDAEFSQFIRDYKLNPDYIGTRRFSYPIAKVKDGKIPKIKKTYSGVREVNEYIATNTAKNIFYDKTLNYAKVDQMPFIIDLAKYIAESYRDEWDSVPHYLEPLNEPMIHAGDSCKAVKGPAKKEAIEAVITYICKYHRELARAVKSTPELKNMQVMGFGSAFPEFEASNFGLWDSRFRQFIDIAGEDIDILSFHLYDGSGVNNAGGRRTGSNLEAIMDMLQTYSNISLGKVLPMAITEYGRLVPNQPEWIAQTGANNNSVDLKGKKVTASNYNPVTNAQAVRSQLSMVMSFMNRQNEIVKTCPFTIGKAPQTALYCKSSLWVKQEDGSYEYSNRKYFFEMLKELKGETVAINSDNIDVQTLALVDGNTLYVMLNNLEEKKTTVNLNIAELKDLKGVEVKSLKIHADKEPDFDVVKSKSAPESVTLEYGETIVLTYKCKKDIKFSNKVTRTKYYSKDYLFTVEPNKVCTFGFDGVPTAKGGDCILRLGVARAHGLSVVPEVIKINGTTVNVNKDVIKGYDQATRKMFFGALEIPFDGSLLKNGENKVEVNYSSGKGHITTAILQIEQ